MTPEAIGGVGLLIFFALLVIGAPIGVAMGLVGIGGLAILLNPEAALIKAAVISFETLFKYELGVLPLFLLMAHLCFSAGASRDFFRVAAKFLGHKPGGLALASIGAVARLSLTSRTAGGDAAQIKVEGGTLSGPMPAAFLAGGQHGTRAEPHTSGPLCVAHLGGEACDHRDHRDRQGQGQRHRLRIHAESAQRPHERTEDLEQVAHPRRAGHQLRQQQERDDPARVLHGIRGRGEQPQRPAQHDDQPAQPPPGLPQRAQRHPADRVQR